MRRCEVCFAPLPAWEDAYLWPCAHGGLTVCADCFDTLVGGLSRRELAARLSAIQIFFSSVHLPSVSVSLQYPLSMRIHDYRFPESAGFERKEQGVREA